MNEAKSYKRQSLNKTTERQSEKELQSERINNNRNIYDEGNTKYKGIGLDIKNRYEKGVLGDRNRDISGDGDDVQLDNTSPQFGL